MLLLLILYKCIVAIMRDLFHFLGSLIRRLKGGSCHSCAASQGSNRRHS